MQTLVTKQTGPAGKPVNTLYIANKMKLKNEMYFALLLDRGTMGPMIIACSEGDRPSPYHAHGQSVHMTACMQLSCTGSLVAVVRGNIHKIICGPTQPSEYCLYSLTCLLSMVACHMATLVDETLAGRPYHEDLTEPHTYHVLAVCHNLYAYEHQLCCGLLA